MTADQQPQFPGWEAIYQQQAIETMPWFYPELDDDLRQALDQLGLRDGSALDLGTGPGTQAMELARRGFSVTGTDISEAAIRLAREKAQAQGLAIAWQQDDILSTRLTGPFDLIFDRGCFHVLAPERREEYVSTVAGLLKPGGYLFLKCFSHLQPGTQGPHRFTPEQIRELFSSQLQVCEVKETVYQGTLDPLPRALFCLMHMKPEQHDSQAGDLPVKLASPARRALVNAGYLRLEQLAQVSTADLKQLHGMGPKALDQLRQALAAKGLSFADERTDQQSQTVASM